MHCDLLLDVHFFASQLTQPFYLVQMREGYGRSLFEPLLPLVLGRDISGEVTGVGNNVRHFQVGQQVFGALHPTATRGTYSDYAILGEEQLAPKPELLSHTVYGPSNYPCFPLIHVFLQIIHVFIVLYLNIPTLQSPVKSDVCKAVFNDIVMMLGSIIILRAMLGLSLFFFLLGHQAQICHDSEW